MGHGSLTQCQVDQRDYTVRLVSHTSALVHEQDPLRRVGQVGEDVARELRALRVELEHRPRGLVRVRVRVSPTP